MDEVRWDVAYTLDDWPEVAITRARNAAQAAFNVALDLADRGFGDRVRFTDARKHAGAGKPPETGGSSLASDLLASLTTDSGTNRQEGP